MVSLLGLLIVVYAVLAALVYDRRPEALSNRVLSLFLAELLAANLGLLILETATTQREAVAGARVALAFMAMANAVGLPYVLLNLHFGTLSIYFQRRPVLRFAVLAAAGCAAGGVLWASAVQQGPLVARGAFGYGLVFTQAGNLALGVSDAFSLVGGLLTGGLVWWGLRRGKFVPRWLGGLYLLVILLGILVGITAVWALRDGQMGHPLGFGLSHIPLVTVFLYQIVRHRRSLSLPQVIRTLAMENASAALALDGQGTLVWEREGTASFLGLPPAGSLGARHVQEIVQTSPLGPSIETLLEGGGETVTQHLERADDTEHTVRITLRRVENVPEHPGLRLLIFEDVTAETVRRALADRQRDIYALSAITEAIAGSLDVEQVMQTALEQILSIFPTTEAASIYLLDPAQSEVLRLAAHRALPAVNEAPPPTVGLGQSLVGTAAKEGKAISWQKESGIQITEEAERAGFRSGLAVPVTAHGRIGGALAAMDCSEHVFAPLEVALLESIGHQVGAAVANAQQYQRTLRRKQITEHLAYLGLTLGALSDEKEVLMLVCRESKGIFGVDATVLWLLEPDSNMLVAKASCGAEIAPGWRVRNDDIAGLEVQIIRARRPLYENHIVEQGLPVPAWRERLNIRAQIGAPLLRETQPVGVMLLMSTREPDRFDANDLELVNLLAVQISLALQNARQTAEINRRLNYERLVNEVGRYATAILRVDKLIWGVCRQIYSAFGYDLVALFLLEEGELTSLEPRAVLVEGKAAEPSTLDADALPMSAVEKAAARYETVCVSVGMRIQGEPAGRSDLVVPMFMAARVIGALVVSRHQIDAIGLDEKEVLQTLAAQLSISLSNARLFDAAHRHSQELEARVAARTAEIAAQHEQTSAILRSVADAVLVANPDGHILRANPQAARLLAPPLSARVVRRWVRRLTEDLETKEEMELESRVYQATVSPVMLEGKPTNALVIVLHDITRLHELDRLKSQFVAQVSHELRTPLTNIKLYASLLRKGKAERREHYLKVVEREANRLDDLVRDLLDLSRLERQQMPPEREWLNLDDLITMIVDNHIVHAEAKGLTLSYHVEGELPLVQASRSQLIQLFTNLVGNAIVYTDQGGQVTVYASASDGDNVYIQVEDTGIGIAENELPHIFDPFYRSEEVRDRPGTGLGLAIVKEIITLHYGIIDVGSELGRGSTFSIVLPVNPPTDK